METAKNQAKKAQKKNFSKPSHSVSDPLNRELSSNQGYYRDEEISLGEEIKNKVPDPQDIGAFSAAEKLM